MFFDYQTSENTGRCVGQECFYSPVIQKVPFGAIMSV